MRFFYEQIANQLRDSEFFRDTGKRIPLNFVTVEVWEIKWNNVKIILKRKNIMFFNELCLIIEKTVDDNFKNLLAQSILYAQDIKELSWDDARSVYKKDNFQSSVIACKYYQIDEFWIQIVAKLNEHAWNDIQSWANSLIK